jgi:hypothetical protein
MKLLTTALLFAALSASAFAATDVTVTASMAFPESLTSTADGTIYIGSLSRAEVYRALPGQAEAKTWITKEAGKFSLVLGVLADTPTDTLWVCDNAGDRAYLKTFGLRSGVLTKSYELPGGGFCNDLALTGKDAYVSDP